jgi:hypothetical protein
MTAKHAALAALAAAVLSAPASAAGAEIAVDQPCYAEGGIMAINGAGYTPGAIVTLTLGGTTSSADADETGGFTTTLNAPSTTLKHPGAQQTTLTTRDTSSGAETATPINIAKTGVDGVPAQSKPHKRIMWNLAGFPGIKAIYGHWRIRGKTRADHRMGVPKGPCGVLHVKARQIEADRVLFGIWTVQFDFNRRYDKHATPRATVKINVFRTFG